MPYSDMRIIDTFAIEQAIANVKLENLQPNTEIIALMKQGTLNTTEILKIILNG